MLGKYKIEVCKLWVVKLINELKFLSGSNCWLLERVGYNLIIVKMLELSWI